MTDFKFKYLKYKNKYINLKNYQQTSGANQTIYEESSDEESSDEESSDEDFEQALKLSMESYDRETTTMPAVLQNFSDYNVEPQECGGEGNCFFHAVSHLTGGDSGYYTILRNQLADYLASPIAKDGISQDFWNIQSENNNIRNEGVYIQDDIQITATSTIIKRPIRIFDDRGNIRVFRGTHVSGEPINLYHLVPRHYKALVPVHIQTDIQQVYEVRPTDENPNILKLHTRSKDST